MKVRIDIQPHTCLLAALAIMLLPLRWIAAALAAAAVHEAGHLLCLNLTGCAVHSISVGPNGAVISAEPDTLGKELLSAAGGPAASFALLLLARYFPMVALFGVVQGLYNLIPIYPNDGGRMLRCVLKLVIPEHSDTIENGFAFFTVFLILCTGIYCIWQFPNQFLHIVLAIFLILRPLVTKFPCKRSAMRVQ